MVHAARALLLSRVGAPAPRPLGAEPPGRAAGALDSRPRALSRPRAGGAHRERARAGARDPGPLEEEVRLGRRPRRRARSGAAPSPTQAARSRLARCGEAGSLLTAVPLAVARADVARPLLWSYERAASRERPSEEKPLPA